MTNESEDQIELLRKRLEQMINQKGYTAQETVNISQQLDALLNELHQK